MTSLVIRMISCSACISALPADFLPGGPRALIDSSSDGMATCRCCDENLSAKEPGRRPSSDSVIDTEYTSTGGSQLIRSGPGVTILLASPIRTEIAQKVRARTLRRAPGCARLAARACDARQDVSERMAMWRLVSRSDLRGRAVPSGDAGR